MEKVQNPTTSQDEFLSVTNVKCAVTIKIDALSLMAHKYTCTESLLSGVSLVAALIRRPAVYD
jgi:hypothetical protein